MYLIQVSYSQESFPAILTGGGDQVGYGGALMVPATGVGETIEQVIELEFKGTQMQIESGVRFLDTLLQFAAEQTAKPAGDLVYLECQVAATDALWRSPIAGGYLELGKMGADQRPGGIQGGRLHLVRANWWETTDEVTLANASVITNHRDGGHSNMVYLAADAGEKDLPARARVAAALSTAVTAPAALFVGMRSGTAGALDLFFEGQDGAARAGVVGSTVVDVESSNGSYYNLAWSGASETALWQVDLSAAALGLARGKPFRVMMRLGDGNPSTASERLWVRWAVLFVDAGGVERTLYETPGAYMPNLNELVLGPVLYLPPWTMQTGAPDLRVVLKATAAGTGAHALKLDYVDFCPLDGWRYYEPVLRSYGLSVNDWGQNGMAGPAGGVMTHSLEGPGFLLDPRQARQFQFYFQVLEAAETSASANLAGTASVYYRPRKRTL